MISRLLPWLILILFATNSFAQTCIPNYLKTYGGTGTDEGFDIIYTDAGSSVVAGRSTSSVYGTVGVLMKLNSGGDILWTKSYANGHYSELTKLKNARDGGFIATGLVSESALAIRNALIVRTDVNGNLLWSKTIVHPAGRTSIRDIIQLPDSSFVFAMNVNDSSTQSDGIVIRLDKFGNLMWNRSFDNGGQDALYALAYDGFSILAVGYTTVSFSRSGVASKLDPSSGAIVWTKRFTYFPSYRNEIVRASPLNNGFILALIAKDVGSSLGEMFVFTLTNDTAFHLKTRFSFNSATIHNIGNTHVEFSGDSSFVFTTSDTTAGKNSVYRKVVLSGFSTPFQRGLMTFKPINSFEGIKTYDDKGVLATGTLKNYGFNAKIQVIKTDWDGNYGPCTPTANDISYNNVQLSSTTSVWSFTGSAVLVNSIALSETSMSFSQSVVCQKQDCIPPSVSNSPACQASMLMEYWNQYGLVTYESLKVSDGYLVSGFNQKNRQPLLMKLAFNGAVVWSKTINSDHHISMFRHILPMQDGNFLLAGRAEYNINQYGHTVTSFVKVTPDGSTLWAKYINNDVNDIKPNADGTFSILHYPDGFANNMARSVLDMAGNFANKKRFNKNFEIVPFHHRSVFDGTTMFAAGVTHNEPITIERFDSSGIRQWSHRVNPDGKAARVEGIYLIGDSIYVVARMKFIVNFVNIHQLVLVKVNKNGTGINAVLIPQNFVSDIFSNYAYFPQIYHAAKTNDGNFVFVDRIPGSPDSVLAVIKFNPIGQVLWAKKFPALNKHVVTSVNNHGQGITVTGVRATIDADGNTRYQPFFLQTNNEGEIDPSSNGFCSTISFPVTSTVTSLSHMFQYVPCTPNYLDLDWPEANFSVSDRLMHTVTVSACGIEGDCSTLNISGSSSACTSKDTLTYFAQRNSECHLPVSWSADTAFVKIISSTDTSVSVTLRKAGSTKIYSSISTSCGLLKDSLYLNIFPSASTLDLGADSVVCPGNSILLNAHSGFLTYTWQDGSSDSTYNATQPGLYHVTVTDSCTGTRTDSITILPHPPIPFYIGSDRVKCNNDTIQLQAPAGFMNYTWFPNYNISATNGVSIIANPSVDTVYSVQAELTPGCFVVDTVRVSVNHSPPVDLGNDLSICYGDSIQLDAGAGFSSYYWNGVSGGQTIRVSNADIYMITASTIEGCVSKDTLVLENVWPLPQPAISGDSTLCYGGGRILQPGNFVSYLWQDGSTQQNFTATDTGFYYVIVTDQNQCVGKDSVRISKLLPLPGGFLPQDTTICTYEKLLLQPRLIFQSYQWNNGATQAGIAIDKPGIYWLDVTGPNGCKGRDSITVLPKQCMQGVFIPTAFSPNQDSKNDIFKASVFGAIKFFELNVYNRWGQLVFSTNNPSKGWDGTLGSVKQHSEIYVWTCRYVMEGSREVIEKGTVMLIR